MKKKWLWTFPHSPCIIISSEQKLLCLHFTILFLSQKQSYVHFPYVSALSSNQMQYTYLDGSEGVSVRIKMVRQSCRMMIDQDIIIGDARWTSHVAATLVVGLTRQEILHLPLVPKKQRREKIEYLTAQSTYSVGGPLWFQEVCYDSDLQSCVGRIFGEESD